MLTCSLPFGSMPPPDGSGRFGACRMVVRPSKAEFCSTGDPCSLTRRSEFLPGAVLAYITYSAVTYTGLYRAAAEWQRAQFGAYGPERTVLALLIGLCLPACLLATRPG